MAIVSELHGFYYVSLFVSSSILLWLLIGSNYGAIVLLVTVPFWELTILSSFLVASLVTRYTPNPLHQQTNGDFIKMSSCFHDKITGGVWHCAKNLGICTGQIFFARVLNMMYFYNFGPLSERFFLQVNFLKQNFRITRNKPLNTKIPYQYAE